MDDVLCNLSRRRRTGSSRIAATWCEQDEQSGFVRVMAEWSGGGSGGGYSVITTEMWISEFVLVDRGII